jgi:hypothetical protein|nr:MAG TPA: hypothetical protein [Caudoviricetes sp.]
MKNIEQKNTQEVQQENLLEGEVIAEQTQTEERPQAIQLVQPKEAEDKIAELERQYRETVERENK